MGNKCGAKKSTRNGRKGGKCGNRGMTNGRCRFHGGMSTGPKVPNTRLNAFKDGKYAAFKTGMYARQLNGQAAKIVLSDRLGSLDHELEIARFQLAMAMRAQAQADGGPELEEIVEHDLVGFGSKKDTTSRVRDYAAIIDKRLLRIESLEKSRMMLLLQLGGDVPPDMDAAKLTPGSPDEKTPANPIR